MKNRKLVNIKNIVVRRLMILLLIVPAVIIIGTCGAIIGVMGEIAELLDDCKSIWGRQND